MVYPALALSGAKQDARALMILYYTKLEDGSLLANGLPGSKEVPPPHLQR